MYVHRGQNNKRIIIILDEMEIHYLPKFAEDLYFMLLYMRSHNLGWLQARQSFLHVLDAIWD